MKPFSEHSLEKFDQLIKTARVQARKAGLKKADIKEAIVEARALNSNRNLESCRVLKSI